MKLNVKSTARHLGRSVQMNSPTILSAVAVVGVAATGYLTFKATWQASRIVDDAQSDRAVQADVPMLTKQEQALKVWKLYIPAVTTGVMTVGCIVASNRIAVRRLAAFAAAYGVLSGDFDEYRAKAQEILGEKKAKLIGDKAAEEKIKASPPPQNIFVEDGKAWFCDLSTMRYIKSDRQTVEDAFNKLNYQLLHGGDTGVSLNAAYAFLGLRSTSVGDILGWTDEQQVEFVPTPVLMDDGSSATGIKFSPEPSPDFDSVH